MDTAQFITAIIAAITGSSAVGALAYFRWKPGQKETTEVNVAQAYVNVAKGTVELVTDTFEDRFRAMNDEMAAMRAEHAKFREASESRHAELSALLRASRANEAEVKRKNGILERRVADLEAEVERLNRTSTTTTTTKTDTTPESTTTKTDVTTSDVKRVEE